MNKLIKNIIIVIAVGILLGVFTSFGQTYLPKPFTQLANSYSMWLLFSFAVGYSLKLRSKVGLVITGILVQYIAILFYYAASSVRFDMSFTINSLISLNIVWIIGGTLAGLLAAVAGAMVANKSKYLSIATGFMAGLFFSEALYQFMKLHYIAEGIVFLTTGVLFLGFMYLKTRYSILKTLLSTVLFTGLMYVGYAYVLGGIFA